MTGFPNDTALILVDIQNDFCPSGALAVPNGDLIIDPVNRVMPLFPTVAATKDWHPWNHCSFKQFGGVWPVHCVQNTPGANFHPDLDLRFIQTVALKGSSPDRDVFQGLKGFTEDGRSLEDWLRSKGVTTLYVAGLATDYCVHATVIDAMEKGFRVNVISDAIKAVEVIRGDGERAVHEMKSFGAELLTSDQVVAQLDRRNAARP